ncbi:hypothetical protein [Microbulbifer sp. Q7]|uniref:hypothetical protein n=1 Tax=Microbulbifer sp. Q7 TaxID=1785091 RepID=UPI000A5E155F|nr:hypothetical protein [Microbulbifer sp. Q7]
MRRVLILLLLSFPFCVAQAQSSGRPETFGGSLPDRWLLGAEVYLWGASVGGESRSGDNIDIGFDELVKDLEMGFMGTLAASRNEWTVFADMIYLNVSDDIRQTVRFRGDLFRVGADIDLEGFVSTLGGAYRFYQSDSTRLNLTLGARYLDLDVDVTGRVDRFGRFRISRSGSVWDGVIGLRGKTDLDDRWYLTYYADVGGGDSDSTWQALAAVNYRCYRYDIVGGYRYLKWNFDRSPYFDDLDLSGFFAGVKFSF